MRALATRLRAVYEAAFAEVEQWSKTAAGQLEAQLQERRTSFGRRIEAIDRIQQAAGGLDERVAEIESAFERGEFRVYYPPKVLALTASHSGTLPA